MPTTDCWQWPGPRFVCGYGKLRVGGRWIYAHRAVYEMAVGPIPDGLVVRHDCDNPICVNPAHLRLGTQRENMADAMERGRIAVNERNARCKYPPEMVAQLLADWVAEEGVTQAELAKRYGINQSYVSRIVRRHRRVAL